jgi:hypothetical protein
VAPPRQPLAARPLRVLALGALGIEKGGLLLEATAQLAKRRGSPVAFTLLGYALRELQAVEVLGAYRDEALDQLIEQQDPDLIWFPCRWPETYSYTLSAALRAGRALLVPDIGSFPERVVDRPWTWIQPYASGPDAWLARLEDIRVELADAAGAEAVDWRPPPIGEFRYDDAYLAPAPAAPPAEDFSLQDVAAQLAGAGENRAEGRRIRVLHWLLWLKRHPALAWISRLVPLRWQRAVKRRLSPRPIHDITRG